MLDAFTLGQVSKTSGVSAKTLDYWAATGFLPPSIKKSAGSGTRRQYSFSDLVAARVARDLRAQGISLQGLRRVVRELRKQDFSNPVASARLIVSGRDVYLRDNDQFISMLRTPGQTRFPLTVLDLTSTVEIVRREAAKVRAA